MPTTAPDSLRKQLQFAVGVGLGFLIWLLSPSITGRPEPWDGSIAIYALQVAAAAFATACIAPRGAWWRTPLSLWLGQLLFAAFRDPAAAFFAAIAIAIFSTVPALLGAALARAVMGPSSTST